MINSLYWIGIRESELEDVQGLFAGSITVFGSGQNGNRAFEQRFHVRYDYNLDNDEWNRFVVTVAREVIEQDPNCRFLLYSPDEAGIYGAEVERRALCQNPESLLALLGNKFLTRQWLSDYVPILPYKMQHGAGLGYQKMIQSFPGYHSFVVQAAYSCGGSRTWLLTGENHEQILSQLDQEELYAVSPYQSSSISPNIHLIVCSEKVQLLPPSLQLIELEQNNFSYKGSDFPAYRTLPAKIDKALKGYALQIGDILRRAGYRGVCGIDFLICGDIIYLMEINARFQSSSFLINRALREKGYTCSVQSLHLSAFQRTATPEVPQNIFVPYSFFHYSYALGQEKQLQYMWKLLRTVPDVDCVDDCLDWTMQLEPKTYLYKAVFRGNISAISPEFTCRVHSNVGIPKDVFEPEELGLNLERLKLMLLSHGTRLSRQAADMLMNAGGFNHEEFEALDIVLSEHVYVCAPYGTNRSELSPFSVELSMEDSCFLSYYGHYITKVRVRQIDTLSKNRTRSGILYQDIIYLSNDRLRVYQRLGCYFKDCGQGCKFCDIPKDDRTVTMEDIFQALEEYRGHPNVRHYLIGGGSTSPDSDFETAEAIAKFIRDTTGKPIYLMSLPPKTPDILKRLHAAGITEIAFNLEIFDRNLAKKYMPGKGTIPFFIYDTAFRTATQLWGKTGNVRSIFVVGLEPAQSLLRGIQYVAQMGVSPILSLFRPLTGTPLQGFLAPSDKEIWDICQQAKAICRRHHVELGPACPYCEDNTLKITL